MNRNAAIDLSRALAVILVTMSHVSRGSWLPSFSFGKFDIFGFLQNGWIGVGIFFVISGYCMGISSKNEFSERITLRAYIRYALKRFLRIAPPYYASLAIWVFIIRFYHIAPKSTELTDILTHLSFTHNFFKDTFFSISGVYWSIAVEMQFYIILPFVLFICRGLASSILFLIFCLLLSIFINLYGEGVVVRWSLLNYLFLFVFGLFLYSYRDFICSYINRFHLLPVFVFIFITLLCYKGQGYSNDQKAYEILASVSYGFIMLGMNSYVANLKSYFMDTLLLIGKASFSIYLYNYIYNVVTPRGINYFAMIFMILGTLAFGVIMYITIEYYSEKFRAYLFKKQRTVFIAS